MMNISPIYLMKQGEYPFIGMTAAKYMIAATYGTMQKYAKVPAMEYIHNALAVVMGTDRLEQYIYVDDIPVATVQYIRVTDIHVGDVATPLTVLVLPEFRNNREVARLIIGAIRSQVKLLCVDWYYTSKHTSSTTIELKLRRFKDG